MSVDFICVSGYGKSGSGACIDLLKEFEYIGGIDNEFRMAKDPGGLLDLENSLVSNWEFVRHNVAIDDFLSYCAMLSRSENLFSRVGKDFNNKLEVDFLLECEKYIDKLTNYEYLGETLLQRYRASSFEVFLARIRFKFGIKNSKKMHFSKPSQEFFLEKTRELIDNLYKNYTLKNNLKKVVLDQAVSPSNIVNTLKFFSSKKIIIIDRDPRDIFTTMIREGRLLGASKLNSNLVDKFIFWHKSMRSRIDSNRDYEILELRFEDFFIDYELTVDRIKGFLEFDFPHIHKYSRFDPNDISKHVGIWSEMENTVLMDKILSEFPDSCFID